jgi:hypothetical protein
MRRTALFIMATVALSGCVPLFLPPVPSTLAPAAPSWRLAGESELHFRPEAQSLELELVFVEVPRAAFVAVQWFGPQGGERASASVWIEPGGLPLRRTLILPSDVAVTPGRWRVVVSVGDALLRQLDVEVPNAGR